MFIKFATTLGVFGGTMLAGAYAFQSLVEKDIAVQYEKMFDRKFRVDNREIYDRQEIRMLQNAMENTPKGIIFLSGRMGSGKTFAVKANCESRKYVSAMNWRGISINTEDELANELKIGLHIVRFKDHFRAIKVGWILTLFSKLVPSIEFEKDMKKLRDVLDELEKVLLFSAHRSIEPRPVIYIDEIASLAADNKGNELFLNWLVKISRDNGSCHVIVSTYDSYKSKDLMKVVDPMHYQKMTVSDLSCWDVRTILKRNHSLGEEEIKNILKQQQGKVKDNSSLDAVIFELVGGLAQHAIFLCEATSGNDFFLRYCQIKHAEAEAVDKALQQAAPSGWRTWFTSSVNQYSLNDLKAVMVQFQKDGNPDPTISRAILMQESGVKDSALRNMVEKTKAEQQSFLYYDEARDEFRVRSKLFLDAYKERESREERILSLRHEEHMAQSVLDRFKNPTDLPEHTLKEIEEAKVVLRNAKKELKLLGA